jgi:hypothetical protein
LAGFLGLAIFTLSERRCKPQTQSRQNSGGRIDPKARHHFVNLQRMLVCQRCHDSLLRAPNSFAHIRIKILFFVSSESLADFSAAPPRRRIQCYEPCNVRVIILPYWANRSLLSFLGNIDDRQKASIDVDQLAPLAICSAHGLLRLPVPIDRDHNAREPLDVHQRLCVPCGAIVFCAVRGCPGCSPPNPHRSLGDVAMQRWDIYQARRTPAKLLGTIGAPDADAAIEAAVTKFGVTATRLIAVRQSQTAATIYLNAEGTTRPNNVV